MNSGLGGFKNMLRRWRINLKNKKKLQQQQTNITKYPRLKSFIYSMVAIVYYPIGLMVHDKTNYTKAKEEHPKLYKEINSISEKLDEIVIKYDDKTDKKIIKIEKEIKKIKEDIKKPMSIESKNYFKDKIDEVEIKKEYVKNPEKRKTIKTKDTDPVKEGQKDLKQQSNIEHRVLESFPILEQSNEKVNNEEVILKSVEKDDIAKSYIKETTSDIKKIEEELNKISVKINETNVYNNFYEFENQLAHIRKKIEVLKEKYKALKESYEFEEYDFDEFNLYKDDKKLDSLIENIEAKLKIIELKKYEIYYKKEEAKNEEKIEEKVETKNSEKEEKKEEININIKAQEMVLSNINKQNEYFSFYMKQLEKSTNHKKTLFDHLFTFTKTILSFSLSLLPISILKNKALGTFVSGIMVNNSIKTMRKMVNPELEINYEMFIDKYYTNKELLLSSYFMCENSLQELDQLKDELMLLNYSVEAAELYKKVESLENHLLVQREDLKRKNGILDKVYIKVKKEA